MTPGPGRTVGAKGQTAEDESFVSWILREQIFAPQYLPGNVSIVAAVGLFAGGVLSIRTWGDWLLLGL